MLWKLASENLSRKLLTDTLSVFSRFILLWNNVHILSLVKLATGQNRCRCHNVDLYTDHLIWFNQNNLFFTIDSFRVARPYKKSVEWQQFHAKFHTAGQFEYYRIEMNSWKWDNSSCHDSRRIINVPLLSFSRRGSLGCDCSALNFKIFWYRCNDNH